VPKEAQKDVGKIDASKLVQLPPEKIQKIVDSVAKELVKELNSPLLVMYYPVQTEVGMYAPDVPLVYNLLRKVDRSKKLTVLIHSGGRGYSHCLQVSKTISTLLRI